MKFHRHQILVAKYYAGVIVAGYEAYYGLPVGYYDYHEQDPLPKPYRYLEPIGSFFPPELDEVYANEQEHADEVMGPPDWVLAQEGIRYSCKDVTIAMRARLPIPEGCLNGDM